MRFVSGGELVRADADLGWAGRLVARAAGGSAAPLAAVADARPDAGDDAEPTVRIHIQATTRAFARSNMRPVARGAYSDGEQTVLIDAAGSGFDLLVRAGRELEVTARYRPRVAIRTANLVLAERFALLVGQVLVHYPVLWRAGWRRRVPLHASVLRLASGTLMLAGPGGVGKSAVLMRALADGATATTDNLCCADNTSCFGLAEPLRTDALAAHGRRTSHGRVELPLVGREPSMRPERLIVLERGLVTEIESIRPAEASRGLVAGTYAAGELRRYWAFCATLALATGRGPAHPPLSEIATRYAERMPCLRLRLGPGATISLADLGSPVR